MIIPGDGKRAQAPAVEAVLHGDDLVTGPAVAGKGIFECGLHGAFDGFRTAVAEENFVHARDPAEFFRGSDCRLIVEKIRDMNELFCLLLQGFCVSRVAVAEGGNGDAGEEIQIGLAVGVKEADAFAVVQDDRETIVCVEEEFLACGHDLLCVHNVSPYCTDFINPVILSRLSCEESTASVLRF